MSIFGLDLIMIGKVGNDKWSWFQTCSVDTLKYLFRLPSDMLLDILLFTSGIAINEV